jgi:hypothetical protein
MGRGQACRAPVQALTGQPHAEDTTTFRSAARRALLTRLNSQPASGEPRSWRRDDLWD